MTQQHRRHRRGGPPAALLATPGSLDFMQVRDMKAHGCPVKLLEMSQGMRLTYQVCLGRRVG